MNSPAANLVFKLTTQSAWRTALACGHLAPSPDDVRDGYIHLSASHQVGPTADRYFTGVADLMLIAVHTAQLGAALRWEVSRGGDRFPHLYAPLPVAAAFWVEHVALDAAGRPQLPPQERLDEAAHQGRLDTEAHVHPPTGETDP